MHTLYTNMCMDKLIKKSLTYMFDRFYFTTNQSILCCPEEKKLNAFIEYFNKLFLNYLNKKII